MTNEPSNLDLVREATDLIQKLKSQHAEVIAAAEESNDLWTANAISELKETTARLSELVAHLLARSYTDWAMDEFNKKLASEIPNWPNPSTHPYQ
jgi:hypothetical protein